jgi:hypothetical protein
MVTTLSELKILHEHGNGISGPEAKFMRKNWFLLRHNVLSLKGIGTVQVMRNP